MAATAMIRITTLRCRHDPLSSLPRTTSVARSRTLPPRCGRCRLLTPHSSCCSPSSPVSPRRVRVRPTAALKRIPGSNTSFVGPANNGATTLQRSSSSDLRCSLIVPNSTAGTGDASASSGLLHAVRRRFFSSFPFYIYNPLIKTHIFSSLLELNPLRVCRFLEWRICCVAGHCVRHRQIPQTGIPRRVHQVPKRPLRHVLCLLRASRLRQIGACSRQGVDGLLCACHTIHPEVATLVLRPDTSRAAARRQGCPSGFRTQDFCNHLYVLFSITFFISKH